MMMAGVKSCTYLYRKVGTASHAAADVNHGDLLASSVLSNPSTRQDKARRGDAGDMMVWQSRERKGLDVHPPPPALVLVELGSR